MVAVPHKVARLERMLDYRGVRLERLHCTGVSSPRVLKMCHNTSHPLQGESSMLYHRYLCTQVSEIIRALAVLL